jgi:hypothetical protein
MDKKNKIDKDNDNKIFIEKDFYVEPPQLSDSASKKEIKEAWGKWDKANKKERANHKRKWTKSQKPGEMPNFDSATTLVKINGVWRQRMGMVGYVGDADLRTLEVVLTEKSKQDRYFQPRGQRANKKGNKHKSRRNNKKRKDLKRQKILNNLRVK